MTEYAGLLDYLEAVASPAPAPGAGSVAAMVGAMGCALGEMVCGISIRGTVSEPERRLTAALGRLTECRQALLGLSEQDAQAYLAFREAMAMPRSTESERDARAGAMAQTLSVATEVPLEIAETGNVALETLLIVAELGSKHAMADVSTAVYAIEASVKGALENVWVNIRLMKSAESSEQFRTRADDTLLGVTLNVNRVLAALGDRGDRSPSKR